MGLTNPTPAFLDIKTQVATHRGILRKPKAAEAEALYQGCIIKVH